jgi:type I restriction enzyme S subunit
MLAENKINPVLRFKNDDGGDFQNWNKKRLGEVSEVKGGKRIPKGYQLINKNNGYPYITVSDMSNGTVYLDKIKFIPLGILENIKNYRINTCDIYVSVAGTLGLVGIIPKELNGANLTENANKLTNLKINQTYLYQYLTSNYFDKLINSARTINGQPKLAIYALKSFLIGIPSKLEQQKIANFLSSVDTKIEQLSKKQHLLTQYKKGMMQKLFSETIRFKADDGSDYPDWEEKQLGDVSDVRDGTHDSPKFYSVGYPLVTSKNLLKDGTIDLVNVNYIHSDDYIAINKRSNVSDGDILFGMIGTIGNPVRVKSSSYAIKNVALIKEQAILNNNFLIHYLNNELIAKQFYRENTGGTQKFIALGVIRKLKIIVPNAFEQNKIANFLSSVDTKIEQLSKKQNLLTQYKKGMMQKLFSQTIRFKADDGSDYPDWEEKLLKNVAIITTGSTPNTSVKNYYNGSELFVSPADMGRKRYLHSTKTTLSTLGTSKGREVVKGSVLFVCIGSTIGKLAQTFKKCITNQQINAVTAKFHSCNNFLYSLLEFNAARIKLLAGVQAVPQINKTDFSNLKFNVPVKSEQQKIANFLSSIDKKIEQVSQQITQTKQYKKALLQQMFV